LDEEKSKHVGLDQQNGLGPTIFAHDAAEAAKKAQQFLTLAVDWLDCLIGSCGLLLIVSHLLHSQLLLVG